MSISQVEAAAAASARAELARRKITGTVLGLRTGKSQSYWSRRLSGVRPMSLADLEEIAQLVDMPVERFFERSVGVA